jgi:hypothetical protein
MSDDKTPTVVCVAQQLGSGWECERCGLAWDEGDKAPACLPMTFARMRDAALTEAERIEQSQDALVMNTPTSPPIRTYRYQPQLKRAQELRACAKLIDRVVADREILDRLKGRKTEKAA